ncbi:hypothetical protein JVU11DRAFT_6743 [Chiua virens]|nr:hypothetical protein JVU11DRAFT_6743 [Chiua virens]
MVDHLNRSSQNPPALAQDAPTNTVSDTTTKCHWETAEIEALIRFHVPGSKRKEARHVKTKWTQIKSQYVAVSRYCETSGFSWDNHKGANIVGAAAEQVWKEYVGKKSNAAIWPFKKKGFPLLCEMEEIYPDAGATGDHVFHPGRARQQPPSLSGGNLGACSVAPLMQATAGSTAIPMPSDPSDAMDISVLASPAPPMSSTHFAVPSATSTRNKRPLSTVSPNVTTSPSLLFSPGPVPASNSAFSTNPPSTMSRGSKQSCVSVLARDNNSNKTLDLPSINMVTNSITNLTDAIRTSFRDKLSVIGEATQQLYHLEPALPAEQVVIVGEHFMEHETKAQFFLSLKSAECVMYMKKLAAKLSVSSGLE